MPPPATVKPLEISACVLQFGHTMSLFRPKRQKQPATPVGGPACIVRPDTRYRQQWQIRTAVLLAASYGCSLRGGHSSAHSIPPSLFLMKELRPGWVREMGVLNIADQVGWKTRLRVFAVSQSNCWSGAVMRNQFNPLLMRRVFTSAWANRAKLILKQQRLERR